MTLMCIFEASEKRAEELEYRHEQNVLAFRPRDPIAQAHYSAIALEEERQSMSHDQNLVIDLWREKREHEERLVEIEGMLDALTGGSHG